MSAAVPDAARVPVSKVMTPDPLVIPGDLTARDTARLLEFYRVSGAPVVDDDGDLLGVISRSDLVRVLATAPHEDAWSGIRARDLMSVPAIGVVETASVAEAARLMDANAIHRLIVTAAGGRLPVGIVTDTDLVREMGGWEDGWPV